MTVQLQFIRYDRTGAPIILDSATYPMTDMEQVKAKAQSVIESAGPDAHIQAARILDRYGSELHVFRAGPGKPD